MAIVGGDQVDVSITIGIKSQDPIVAESGFDISFWSKVSRAIVEKDTREILGPMRHGKVEIAVGVEVGDGKENTMFAGGHEPLGSECPVTTTRE